MSQPPVPVEARPATADDLAVCDRIAEALERTSELSARVRAIRDDHPEDFAFLVVPRLHPDGPAAEGTSVLRLSRKAGQRAADLLTTAGAFNDVLERLVFDFHTDCSAADPDSRSVAGLAGSDPTPIRGATP